VDISTRLRIATRIHFALLRQDGEDVEIGSLMKGGADAREAMFVCEASGDRELAAMARQLQAEHGLAILLEWDNDLPGPERINQELRCLKPTSTTT